MAVTTNSRVRRQARAVMAPVLLLVAGTAVAGYVYFVDPREPGHYPTCPFLALTGFYDVGCGSARAIHALTHGRVLTALNYNALLVTSLPFLAYQWVQWLLGNLRGYYPKPAHPAVMYAVLGVVTAFWVVRNLPTPLGQLLAP